MRGLALLLAVLFVLAAGVWLLLQRGVAGPEAPDSPAAPVPAAPSAPRGQGAAGASPAASPQLRTPVDLADHPTAFLEVVDATTQAPVAGAAIYRLDSQRDVAAITYTDQDGKAGLPLKKPEQLIVANAGYLLRQAPTQPGSTAERPQLVRLEPDRYSYRVAFRFVRPDGQLAAAVRVRLQPLGEAKSSELPPPPGLRGRPEAVQRAWLEQRTIAALRPVPEVHVQLGRYNADFVHQLAGEDEVRFAAPGQFQLEAATAEGLAARATIEVAAGAAEPFVVPLQAGRRVAGVVRSAASGGPVEGAQVEIAGGDPLDLAAATDAAGRFTLAPLAEGPVSLEVRHRDYEVGRTGPFAAGTDGIAVQLAALPAGSLRGRVRARPRLLPIAGATVSALDPLNQPVTAVTDQDGSFVLRYSGKDAARLNIAAPGFLPYSELVDASAPAPDFDLWPIDTETRLRERLTGVVAGVVTDEQGQPLAAATVRLLPDRALPEPGITGRRVLNGGVLALPLMATSGTDGTFRLETQHAGGGTLQVVDAAHPDAAGTRVQVVPGRIVDGVQVKGWRKP